jgi:hypothetical protein
MGFSGGEGRDQGSRVRHSVPIISSSMSKSQSAPPGSPMARA